MPTDFDDAPDDFTISGLDDAIRWFRDKLRMPDSEYYALEARARARAFTVSGVADLDIMSEVWRAVDRAITDGTTLADFRADALEGLKEQWGGEIPGRLETIFRTNVQSAYSAGRYRFNTKPETRQSHPYSAFHAVLDDRTTDECAIADGTVLPTEDPWWFDHQPPLHFNCRSDVTAVTPEEAHELGVDQDGPDADADEGFGNPFAEFDPDVSDRPADLEYLYSLKEHEED